MTSQIRHIFELFVKTRRFKTVAENLNAECFSTGRNTRFTGQSVASTLRDEKHLDSGAVDAELWSSVQAILEASKRGVKLNRRVAHLCSGILRCGCGQTMYVPTNSKKYTCQKCRNKIAKDDLEIIVLENLKKSGNEEVAEMITNWKNHSFEEKREIIENTVQEIVAEDKKVTLTLFAFG